MGGCGDREREKIRGNGETETFKIGIRIAPAYANLLRQGYRGQERLRRGREHEIRDTETR
jgi:hypothetical protein